MGRVVDDQWDSLDLGHFPGVLPWDRVFPDLPVVDVVPAKRLIGGFAVEAGRVRAQLEPAGDTAAQVREEPNGRGQVPVPDQSGGYQLGLGVDGRERVQVPDAGFVAALVRDVPALGAAEGPELVRLDVPEPLNPQDLNPRFGA